MLHAWRIDASALGHGVIMVADADADADAAVRDADRNATLPTIYRSFGNVRLTAELVEMIGSPC